MPGSSRSISSLQIDRHRIAIAELKKPNRIAKESIAGAFATMSKAGRATTDGGGSGRISGGGDGAGVGGVEGKKKSLQNRF